MLKELVRFRSNWLKAIQLKIYLMGGLFCVTITKRSKKNGGQVSKRLHARKRNRCARENLVTEHNLREFTFVISLIN